MNVQRSELRDPVRQAVCQHSGSLNCFLVKLPKPNLKNRGRNARLVFPRQLREETETKRRQEKIPYSGAELGAVIVQM